MPELDVSDVASSIEFADFVSVIRRATSTNDYGEVVNASTTYDRVVATVVPVGKNLRRDPDAQFTPNEINVVMQLRQPNVAGGQLKLQGASDGFQPDIVVWNGDNYLVINTNDYSAFGGGQVEARCSSVDLGDQP